MTEFTRDSDGNVTNPPVIQEYERRITDAANSGDNEAVAKVQDEYNDAREKLIKEIESDSDDSPQAEEPEQESSDSQPTTNDPTTGSDFRNLGDGDTSGDNSDSSPGVI